MDGQTKAADMIGPLKAQIALCYGVVANTPDALECWQDDLAFGLARALELAQELDKTLTQTQGNGPEAARNFPGDSL